MKTIKRIFLFALCALIFVNVHTLNAQVTIGSELEPNLGSLLDLKEDNTSPGANSTKGFNLPRVALTSLSSLSPCATDNDANKKSHTGLTVYNTTSDDNFTPGTYVWNGSSWITNSQRPKRVGNFTHLGVTSIAAGEDKNVASFTISESGFYAIDVSISYTREPASYGYYTCSIKNNNYTYPLGFAIATTAHPGYCSIGFNKNYIDYFEVGTYYLNIAASDITWKYHRHSTLSLVKLSD